MHRPDGSFVYHGHRFAALIRPDGMAEFAKPSDAKGWAKAVALGGSLPTDLNDIIWKAQGQDPDSAEKRWFLQHTEALRQQLQTQHHAQGMQRDAQRLQGKLASLWNNHHLSAATRRQRIFQLWDECSEEGEGGAARRSIEDFVRQHLPHDSRDAYSQLELRSLNAHRHSPQPFAPYLNELAS